MDKILRAVRLRVFEGVQTQDDLWIEQDGGGVSILSQSFARIPTDFIRINPDCMIVHVQADEDTLRSFIVRLEEVEDE